MAKVIKYPNRIFLPKGDQRRFIESAQLKSGSGIGNLADKIGVHRRTLSDWRREKFLISQYGINKLSKISGLPIPKKAEIRNPFWYTSLGAKIGAKKAAAAMLRKYGYVGGDPNYRKRRWYEWWWKEGKFKKHPIINVALPFKKPAYSSNFAEFIGTMMGDGGMSKRQICITLHHIDDYEYAQYTIKLIKKLFGINPSLRHNPKSSVNNIRVSRTELVKFLHSRGLVIGNKVKQNFDIPQWIKGNNRYLKSCIRGLIDTDGSVFNHRYKVKSKIYSYKKICFTSASPPLIKSAASALSKLGLNPRIAGSGREIRLDSKESVAKYFDLIGSNNPKHLKKYKN